MSMLKNILRKKNSSLDDILDDVVENKRLHGIWNGYAWSMRIGKPHHDGFQEIYEGAWRRNAESAALILCAWQDDKILEDYLHKRMVNKQWVDERIAEYRKRNPAIEQDNPVLFNDTVRKFHMQTPYSWRELSESALTCLEFDYAYIQALIRNEEALLIAKLGVLPRKPSFIGTLKTESQDYQPIVRIEFST